jgi:hypothetical protein
MDQMNLGRAAADAVASLIVEYLTQGGAGFDDELLAEALDVLCNADIITIEQGAAQ